MSNPIRPAIPCYTCPVRDRALCAAFSDEAIAELFARAERLHVDPGRYLYEEGDPSPYVYKIVEGLLMLERLASNGRRQIMAFVYPGDLIGLTPDEQYNVSAKCLKHTELCRFRVEALEELFHLYPDLERDLRRIGNRILNYALDQVFVLGHKTAVERMAFFLLHLANRQKVERKSGAVIDLPMTRTDIADFLGITVETASRAISRLKADGLIHMPGPNRVVIPDFEKLSRAAENYRD